MAARPRQHPLSSLFATALAVLAAVSIEPAHAQTIITPRTERRSFSDAEIIDGFFKVAFGAEYHLAGHSDRIRKFTRPVRVFIDNKAKPDRTAALTQIVADIGKRVNNLDIAVTADRTTANMTVTLVRDRDLQRTIAAFYGADRAREIKRTMDPQCLSSFSKDDNLAILSANIILTADKGTFTFRDCAYEELLQAMGPINDTDTVPWTSFNDQVSVAYFSVYDQYLLNILYDPRIEPGMTVDAVRAQLGAILPDVRKWVAEHNGLAN